MEEGRIAMNDLIVITGARNTGKSFAAATYLHPSEIGAAFVHDSEKSMNRVNERLTAKGLSFGHYGDLNARFSDLPGDDDLLSRISKGQLPWVDKQQKSSLIAYYEYILHDLDTNLHGHRVYVHDTIEKLEAGMAAWVEEHKKQSGVTRLAFGGLWTQGVYPLYEHFVASIFGRGVETIIFTSHLKTPWVDKRPVVGKVAPAGKPLLYKLSSLFLWLVSDRTNNDGAPAGLVLKERMGDLVPDENDEWVISRMLPERIPHCTWKDIREYLEHGCDLTNPADGETMTPSERTMISELISDEQMRLMILGAEQDLAEAQSGLISNTINGNGGHDFDVNAAMESKEESAPKSTNEIVLEMATDGVSAQDIADTVGRPLPVVLMILKGNG